MSFTASLSVTLCWSLGLCAEGQVAGMSFLIQWRLGGWCQREGIGFWRLLYKVFIIHVYELAFLPLSSSCSDYTGNVCPSTPTTNLYHLFLQLAQLSLTLTLKQSFNTSIIYIFCGWWEVSILLVLLRCSVSLKKPEKGYWSHWGLLLIAPVLQCCLWNCTTAYFVSFPPPAMCQVQLENSETMSWVEKINHGYNLKCSWGKKILMCVHGDINIWKAWLCVYVTFKMAITLILCSRYGQVNTSAIVIIESE